MEIEVASSFVTPLSTYKSERSHKAQDIIWIDAETANTLRSAGAAADPIT